ncbi:MAG: S1/P1 nuclease [Flavobacteriaceae bacterium]|nr:S1/P1 nuclease [Flavobacteriaceae bacterium]
MHKSILYIAVFFFYSIQLFANNTPNWGATGHRTVGLIAEKHLTKKSQKQIEKILQGQSLAFVSTYGDEIKSDPKYKKFYAWHFVNFPFNTKYEDSNKSPEGDIITGINYCIDILKNKNSSQEDQVFYLKFLVHLMGDLHQPMHVGKAEDKGGNDFQVRWHNKGTNLHRVWDSNMIESWDMSYSELANNTKDLNKQQIENIQNGSILNWTYETQKLSQQVYKSATIGEKLGYKYSYDHFGTVRSQLQKAGIRLAKILNDIYG